MLSVDDSIHQMVNTLLVATYIPDIKKIVTRNAINETSQLVRKPTKILTIPSDHLCVLTQTYNNCAENRAVLVFPLSAITRVPYLTVVGSI